MKPTISVILTTYNSEQTIERTLRSISCQIGRGELFELEIIVVDDCSTDKTVELVLPFQVRVFTSAKNSGGPNRGRNIGLSHATGDFICIADHDDEWKPDKVKTQLAYTEQVPIVTSGYSIINLQDNKNVDKVRLNSAPSIYFPANKTFRDILVRSIIGQNVYLGSIMFSSSLKHIHFEETFGMIDYDWILRLFKDRDSIEVNQSLYNRYIDGKNLSLNEEYRKRDFYYSLMHIEEYTHSWPREVRIAQKKMYGSRARYYYLMGNMPMARYYFLRSMPNLKNFAYYLTTFWGSEFIKRKYNPFG